MGDQPPVKATAIGGRQARSGETSGNVYDHFSVTFEWANGARGFHMCRQINNCTNDNSDLVLGTKGTADINGWVPRHKITGENPWKHKGKRVNMYQQEHDELFASIRDGKPMNDGIRMAQSTMMSIMGRMAAYTGKTLTWDEALNSKLILGPKEIRWGDYTPEPVAIPGKTKFQ
jgi:predicted dehydrogenase